MEVFLPQKLVIDKFVLFVKLLVTLNLFLVVLERFEFVIDLKIDSFIDPSEIVLNLLISRVGLLDQAVDELKLLYGRRELFAVEIPSLEELGHYVNELLENGLLKFFLVGGSYREI